MKRNHSLFVILICSSPVFADQFCFASAETYYEQVYCQLQAKAQVSTLPPFNQFKKNNEQVQYSLLKRPAVRNAIKLPAPLKQSPAKPPSVQSPPIRVSVAPVSAIESAGRGIRPKNTSPPEPERHLERNSNSVEENRRGEPSCQVHAAYLECEGQAYKLVGNQANHRLAADALTNANRMALPEYAGGDVENYLARAYHTYLDKMREIGLGGVTMTYRKFAYLYQDLHTKGLNFSQRFETMYSFLKKDKTTLAVSERVQIPSGFSAANCAPLGSHLRVCDYQGRNFIFERQ